MQSKRIMNIGLCAALLAAPAGAADLPKGALCALVDIQECDPGTPCAKVTADEIAVPRFIRIELGKRTLQGVGPRARNRVSKIRSVDQRGEVVFAQGLDDAIEGERGALAWVLALDPKEGSLQLTVTSEDATFLASGECLIGE